MNAPDRQALEIFLQESSDHLQYLREYSGLVQESHGRPNDLEKLYIAAHTLAGTSATYGFPHFSEVAAKMAHIFQYALHASLTQEMQGPLTEFLSDAISVLEFDLLQISSTGEETADDIAAFKQRYSFAFPVAQTDQPTPLDIEEPTATHTAGESLPLHSFVASLPEDADVPDEVLEFFEPEAEEHLQSITECLLALEGNPNPDDVNRLFRSIHTIKGSAAQVGLQRLSAVAHRVEDLIGCLREGALQPTAEIVDICLQSVDILKKFLHRQWTGFSEMAAAVDPLLGRIADLIPPESAESHSPDQTGSLEERAHQEPSTAVAHTAPRAPSALVQAKSVRISLDRLDRMMNAVGELVINRTRMLGRLSELSKLVEVLNFSKSRLSSKISDFQEKHEFSRLSATLFPGSHPPQRDTFRGHFGASPAQVADGPLEFTELEMDRYDDVNILSRSLTEISADVTEVLTQLESFMGRVEIDIDDFTKLTHHLQDEITAARMVPIGNLYTRLSRTVRDAANTTGKPIELVLEGADTELDNNIIQHISDPLIHLVRNSVAHGIEDAQSRRLAGKSEKGRITVRAYHRGNHIFIEVEDDGRGIDYDRIRHSIVESGALSQVTAAELAERELREFIFRPGFSTASSMSELAGRGVGLDVVRSNVHSLNGEIDVRSESGRGSCFTVKVPLTLIISQALFVRCGTSTFAFPLAVVEEIRRLHPTEIQEVGGKLLTRVREVITEVIRLDLQLALPPLEPLNGYFHMVIARVAGKQVGVVVEEVLGKDEIVIKNLGAYLRPVKLFPGTTIASDGSLILLIDLNRLVALDQPERTALPSFAAAARVFAPGAEAVAAGTIPSEAVDPVVNDCVIVIADDSISVRKFVGRMLSKAGYTVKLASDGLEASEIVAQSGCHLLITDLEMPRMNGYELMSHLRQDPATRKIPVLVVTSRAGAKHRDRAMKEGASGFLTKPVQEDQLLATVENLLGSGKLPDRKGVAASLRRE